MTIFLRFRLYRDFGFEKRRIEVESQGYIYDAYDKNDAENQDDDTEYVTEYCCHTNRYFRLELLIRIRRGPVDFIGMGR